MPQYDRRLLARRRMRVLEERRSLDQAQQQRLERARGVLAHDPRRKRRAQVLRQRGKRALDRALRGGDRDTLDVDPVLARARERLSSLVVVRAEPERDEERGVTIDGVVAEGAGVECEEVALAACLCRYIR